MPQQTRYPKFGPQFTMATLVAIQAHERQVRKQAGTPYIGHLFGVASIAIEHGADEEEAIAALLHDIIEDQGFSAQVLEGAFGPRVAMIVLACSDSFGEKTPGVEAWRERKTQYLEHLVSEDIDSSVLFVSCCDKIHNVSSIIQAHRTHGDKVFDRFIGKKVGTLWYYQGLAHAYHIAGQRFPATHPFAVKFAPLVLAYLELVSFLEQLAGLHDSKEVAEEQPAVDPSRGVALSVLFPEVARG